MDRLDIKYKDMTRIDKHPGEWAFLNGGQPDAAHGQDRGRVDQAFSSSFLSAAT